jgi:ABC-type polysaccharide/polyol phosphate export permease
MDSRDCRLILQFALKDFKIRYTHSLLGYAWSVLNPLIFSVIYYLVFSVFIRYDVPNYPGYLLLGIVLWSFFAEGSTNGVASLLARAGILGKVAMSRHVVVFAAILNALLTFAIGLVILAALLALTGTRPGWPLLAFPLLLADLLLMTAGVALLLAPLHVRFRDVGYLWGVAVQIGFWLTPIIYDPSMLPARWRWLVTYNPLGRIVLYSRQVVLYGTWPDWVGVGKTSLVAVGVALAGWVVFQRLQRRVVEYF